jgi:hypothetical protein
MRAGGVAIGGLGFVEPHVIDERAFASPDDAQFPPRQRGLCNVLG